VRHPFRRKNLSPRLLPLYLVAAAALALASPTPLGMAAGGAVVCAGAALRTWGAGYLLKNRSLVVAGPYAHLRHPLYAGTLLLGIGFAIVAGPWGLALLAAFFLPAFFLYYLPYKDRIESARLECRYGAAFVAYRVAVPALLPERVAWAPPPGSGVGHGRQRWSWERFRDNGELGTLLAVGSGLGLLALRGSWTV
jgi:protein-S-isoprenylcysteine O-methyltransferase Ste14